MPELPPLLLPPILSATPPVSPTPGHAEPVSADERIETLDAIRGVALFGILLVNMALFSWPFYQVMATVPDWQGADWWADAFVRWFAEGKFYPLFSFLFGVGAAVQMERAETRGGRFARRYLRRLLVLLGIGLVHAFLLWEGDILVLYAVTGLLVLPFCHCRPRTLLVWGAILLALPVLAYAGISLLMGLGSLVPEIARVMQQQFHASDLQLAALAEQNIEAFARGSYGDIFRMRARNVVTIYSYSWFVAPTVLGMFLLGLWTWRQQVFRAVEAHRRLIRRVTLVGWAVGLPLNLAYVILCLRGTPGTLGPLNIVAAMFVGLGGPLLSLAYAGTLTLLLRSPAWQRALRPVAAAGRMGLSNYLLQSLVCTTIFYSYGLAWYGSVGRAIGLGLVVLVYGAQLAWSVWWLKRFRFGPAEWLWRSLTYGERQRLRG